MADSFDDVDEDQECNKAELASVHSAIINTIGRTIVTKEVLVTFRDQRRPIVCECADDHQVEYGRVISAVEETFGVVLSSGEGSSDSHGYFLQRASQRWGHEDYCPTSKWKLEDQTEMQMKLCRKDDGVCYYQWLYD